MSVMVFSKKKLFTLLLSGGPATLSWTEKLRASRINTSSQGADLLCQEKDGHLQMNLRNKWFSFLRTESLEQTLWKNTI